MRLPIDLFDDIQYSRNSILEKLVKPDFHFSWTIFSFLRGILGIRDFFSSELTFLENILMLCAIHVGASWSGGRGKTTLETFF